MAKERHHPGEAGDEYEGTQGRDNDRNGRRSLRLFDDGLTDSADRPRLVQIYLYVATQTYRKWGKNEMPGDIAVDKLDNEQMRDLNRLKAWLYQKRTTARHDCDRAERRETKEAEEAKRKSEQPVLFDF